MDAVAALGVVGRADNVPPALPSGSDVATLSLFGYDPLVCHTGRAPLEAAAQGITLEPGDWAIRCNLVTIVNGLMRSFTAGQIPSDIAALLIAQLQATCGSEQIEFHAGVSYRNLVVYRAGPGQAAPPFTKQTTSTPPHDLTDQPVAGHLPAGPGSDLLQNLMRHSIDICANLPENRQRTEAGELAATQIWLWGLGQRPNLESFQSKYGRRGAMITAVDLLRGIATLLGWRNIVVPGATGYLDTDYAAKGRAAIRALDDSDIVVVHVEATDEASHEGDAAAKVSALEAIDREIVGPVLTALRARDDYRLLISPDHPTFLRTKTHSYGFVPFAMCGSNVVADAATTYDEVAAAESAVAFPQGHELMSYFLE
jgi:2,3-bisphosphoglycerate-independent phosphoglycerate mutase